MTKKVRRYTVEVFPQTFAHLDGNEMAEIVAFFGKHQMMFTVAHKDIPNPEIKR